MRSGQALVQGFLEVKAAMRRLDLVDCQTKKFASCYWSVLVQATPAPHRAKLQTGVRRAGEAGIHWFPRSCRAMQPLDRYFKPPLLFYVYKTQGSVLPGRSNGTICHQKTLLTVEAQLRVAVRAVVSGSVDGEMFSKLYLHLTVAVRSYAFASNKDCHQTAAKPELTGDIIPPPEPHLRLIRHDIGCSPTQVRIDCIIILLLTGRGSNPRT